MTEAKRGEQTFESGITLEEILGNTNFPIGTGAIEFRKSISAEEGTVFDLIQDRAYEPYTKAELNYDLTVKIPTTFGLSVEINNTKTVDFAVKAIDTLIDYIKGE
ncbi:MAG: hypothetical protein LBU00_08275 [Treponema sp.]|jgi:hypothetical protein|nr:hypothetical protein [Treponema sp.]